VVDSVGSEDKACGYQGTILMRPRRMTRARVNESATAHASRERVRRLGVAMMGVLLERWAGGRERNRGVQAEEFLERECVRVLLATTTEGCHEIEGRGLGAHRHGGASVHGMPRGVTRVGEKLRATARLNGCSLWVL
jgi:hypothetical protein